MSISDDDELRKILESGMPKASRIYAWYYTHSKEEVYDENVSLSQLILETMQKIPNNGRIRYKKHTLAFWAIGRLIDELPENDPRLPEIVNLYHDRRAWYEKYR